MHNNSLKLINNDYEDILQNGKSEPQISVIIPVFNVEKYLYKCINSVLTQTYRNLEIILVNDGSTDNCGDICDRYATQDVRIKVIHKENGGLSSARNIGIELSTGDYLFFVDSDDYISTDCIASLYKAIIDDCSDCAVTNMLNVFEDGKSISLYNREKKYYILTREEALNTALYQKNIGVVAQGKLYKKKLFEDIRFPDTLYEDLATFYLIFSKCEKISLLNTEKYFYLQRDNGIVRGCFSDKKLAIIEITERMLAYIKDNHPTCYAAAVCRLISAQFHVYLQIPKSNAYIDKRKEIEFNIRRYRNIVLSDNNSRKKTKYACLLSLFGFGAVRLAVKAISVKFDLHTFTAS